jgi:alkylated DNA repair protein (DNA oxidative demethylase)
VKRDPDQLSLDLAAPARPPEPALRAIAPGALLLCGFALSSAEALLAAIADVTHAAPFRQMQTPGGKTMSVGLTNCGALGWVSDRSGYRYTERDPETQRCWPALPAVFLQLAQRAAAQAGFPGFVPDACLINRYEPGTRLSLHQDRNECDFEQPIVSVSLGLPATFLFGGDARGDRAQRVPLVHGDVVVWGGPARLRFHGVLPIKEGTHPRLGGVRINLTLRKAG